jgi:hypothetical protein
MRRTTVLVVLTFCLAAPSLWAQDQTVAEKPEHFNVGVFADYFRLRRTDPPLNLLGAGVRAGVNLSYSWQLEAELSLDFRRGFTSTFTNGFTNLDITSRVRTIHGLAGPKVNLGLGPLRGFATFKGGFINFSTANLNVPQGFTNSLGAVTAGETRPAIYPGGGLEMFFGHLGVRADAGVDIYFDKGPHTNFKGTFGPVLRF